MIKIENSVLKKSVERDPLLRIHLVAFKIFGFVLFDDQSRKWLHFLRGVIFTISFLLYTVTQLLDFFKKLNDLGELTKTAAMTVVFVTASFRMANFYRNRRRFLKLVETINDELQQMTTLRSNDEKVKEIVATSIKYQRWLTASLWLSAIITSILMCINAAVQAFLYQPNSSATPSPIFPSWFPFDDYWEHFWFIYTVQVYSIVIGCFFIPCWHSFIVSIKIFVIMKLKILSHDLSQLTRDSNEELAKCVDERERIFEFVKELSALISDALFLDFVIISILLCALLLDASQAGLGVQMATDVFFILTMATIQWMYCHHANEITFYSDELTTSAYKCPWYECSVRFRKELLIFMTSANVIKLQAGFIDMNLETFVNILNTSYSYFTLLTSLSD